MSYPYTFRINNSDFSDIIQRYGYETTYDPIYADPITTLDMVDHTVIVRWKHGLKITCNPLSETRAKQLTQALTLSTVPVITFTSLQLRTAVTARMQLDSNSAALVLRNASRRLLGGTELTFVEL